MLALAQWAERWRVPPAALEELTVAISGPDPAESRRPVGETAVTQAVRLKAAQAGCRLWRNNVGAMQDAGGRWVRYGLANDSKTVNERVKSADLIGIRPVAVTAAHVGRVLGQFVSRECKAAGWRYADTPREQAQLRWIQLIASLGGDAAFTTGEF